MSEWVRGVCVSTFVDIFVFVNILLILDSRSQIHTHTDRRERVVSMEEATFG